MDINVKLKLTAGRSGDYFLGKTTNLREVPVPREVIEGGQFG